jgi:hypothetical protein
MKVSKPSGEITIAVILVVISIAIGWLNVLQDHLTPTQELAGNNPVSPSSVPNDSQWRKPNEPETPEEAATALFT